MKKIEKKKTRLQERIKELEEELISSLGKKSSKVEMDISGQQRKIQELKKELIAL